MRRWTFSYPAREDEDRQAAVHEAVRFLREHPQCLPSDAARSQPVCVATLAVAVHEFFLRRAPKGRPEDGSARLTDHERVRVVSTANERLFGDG